MRLVVSLGLIGWLAACQTGPVQTASPAKSPSGTGVTISGDACFGVTHGPIPPSDRRATDLAGC